MRLSEAAVPTRIMIQARQDLDADAYPKSAEVFCVRKQGVTDAHRN